MSPQQIMASGIQVDPQVGEIYNEVKMRRKLYKYLIFNIKNKESIELFDQGETLAKATESREDCSVHFEQLKAQLISCKEPRYVLYDFGFTMKDGRKCEKIAFIFWCPDNGTIGNKMIYASSKDSVKKVFTGVGIEFQANDASDLEYKDLADEVEKKA